MADLGSRARIAMTATVETIPAQDLGSHCAFTFCMFHIGTIAGMPMRPVSVLRRAIGETYFPNLT
ncbi:hypothetical protein [Mesorhizobium delmotii]|uniref:hypothetical protein n=1 Tax=Mesorhizobium delmotii TaxID=1631247 RepID=UPI00140408C2|nr:hypothetical protein [Mesorhizobium delmotii]